MFTGKVWNCILSDGRNFWQAWTISDKNEFGEMNRRNHTEVIFIIWKLLKCVLNLVSMHSFQERPEEPANMFAAIKFQYNNAISTIKIIKVFKMCLLKCFPATLLNLFQKSIFNKNQNIKDINRTSMISTKQQKIYEMQKFQNFVIFLIELLIKFQLQYWLNVSDCYTFFNMMAP